MVQRSSAIILSLSLATGVVVLGGIAYVANRPTPTFSATLASLWRDFAANYIETSTGRTVGVQPDLTTSQDQALTLLRAVWMNDQPTFNRAWTWMKTYLQHNDDSLFASRYGRRSDGSFGVFTDAQGSSSGADADTALALLFAYARWGQGIYQEAAYQILNDIWIREVLVIDGKPYLLAGSAELSKDRSSVLVSPGELPIYAFRVFAGVDRSHDWDRVIDTSYELINRGITEKLDKKKSAQIVPDAFLIDRGTGRIVPGPMPAGVTTDFWTVARMVPWRLTLDRAWYDDSRADTALANMEFLGSWWRDHGRLAARWTHDGKVIDDHEISAVYAGTLGYFLLIDPLAAKKIRDEKLLNSYDAKRQTLQASLTASDAAWIWLALALMQNELQNLLPATVISQMPDPFIHPPKFLLR